MCVCARVREREATDRFLNSSLMFRIQTNFCNFLREKGMRKCVCVCVRERKGVSKRVREKKNQR